MTRTRLVLNSLRHYWRAHLGVLLGAIIAAAVLTGALLVGDSVDYSLRSFALSRLGNTRFVLNAGNLFFSKKLGEGFLDYRLHPKGRDRGHSIPVGLVLRLPGMAIAEDDDRQINQVQILGVQHESFFSAFPTAKQEPPALADSRVALNEKLARALDVKEGDWLSLRILQPSLLSRDAPLSSREDTPARRARFQVSAILSSERLGNFSLVADQSAPYNAFVDLERLQDLLNFDDRINMLLISMPFEADDLEDALARRWAPGLVGLRLEQPELGPVQLESDRIFFDPETSRAALSLPGAHGTLTYLVNTFSFGDKITPYSFVVAGAYPGAIADNEIIINEWLADQLQVQPGDSIRMSYSELLSSNKFTEHTKDFTVRAVKPMDDLKVERELMPEFPGLSDVESCADWDVGMPMDEALLNDPANEAYWDAYRQTPKAFVSLKTGQALWGNRFGNLTAVRFTEGTPESIGLALSKAIDPAKTGLFFQPVRQQALEAVNNAMDFGGLFIGMSFFLILSALTLTGLLFVFGVQRRAAEMGTLLAVGYQPRDVRRLFLYEALLLALSGALLGSVVGSIYTRTLIAGLARYWSGAVAGAALQYYAKPATFAIGVSISFLCAIIAMYLAMRRQMRCPARVLLTGDVPGGKTHRFHQRLTLALALVSLASAGGIVVYARLAALESIVMPFFGAGTLLLIAGLAFCHYAIAGSPGGGKTLARLALRNVARRPGRSLSVIALLASGCFLVFAVSTMQEDVGAHAEQRSAGTGGFELFAESTLPMLDEPGKAVDATGVNIKVHDGDDASCLNLNHALNPRLLGVNAAQLADLRAFVPTTGDNTWRLLTQGPLPDGTIPALAGDSDTAMWGLKKKTGPNGDLLTYLDETGTEVRLRLVGKLPMRMSVFQGTVLIDDSAFTRLYPSEDGYRMFLFDTSTPQETKARLTEAFSRDGLNVSTTVDRLREFHTVESAYLRMFLVLGGLGMVLGSIGMAIVVLRNLLERRHEIALFRAVGYDRQDIRRMLFIEHAVLIAAGLLVGTVSAVVAMVPEVVTSGSNAGLGTQVALFGLIALFAITCTYTAIRLGLPKNQLDALRNE